MYRYGFPFEATEKVLLNEDKMQESGVANDEVQLLNAIYIAFI